MFLSSAVHNLDSKGRVSVPADFRTVINPDVFDGVILWPSADGACLEGADQSLMDEYQRSLDRVAHYDPRRLAVQKLIFARSRRLTFDSAGRISLPADFAQKAGLDKKVMFVGVGKRFEMWNPERYEAHLEEVLKNAGDYQDILVPVDGGPS